MPTRDGGKLDAAFKDGKVGYVFNGPWATGDYVKALGAENLGIADPITLPNGKFAPFLGTKNIFLSSNAQNADAAQAFMWFMAQPETQKMMTEVGHIPSNPAVKTDDPFIAGFLKQTGSASYFPNEPEMGAVWGPAGDMITKVIEGKSEPQAAVEEACTADRRRQQEVRPADVRGEAPARVLPFFLIDATERTLWQLPKLTKGRGSALGPGEAAASGGSGGRPTSTSSRPPSSCSSSPSGPSSTSSG